jgi:hypothetical protein
MRGTVSAASAVAILPLLLVLGFILVNGAAGLSLDLVTQLPGPVGEAGGGMANAFLGTLVLIVLASALALPVGILAGIYLAEFGHNAFGHTLRFLPESVSRHEQEGGVGGNWGRAVRAGAGLFLTSSFVATGEGQLAQCGSLVATRGRNRAQRCRVGLTGGRETG